MVSSEELSEIAFFDVETTVPTRPGQGYAILEFGSILVCPRKLVEVDSYTTLVRPRDISLISDLSVRCNGITEDAVVSAPSFSEIADKVYRILHGRIWAGHNILRFDCARIREAFAQINRLAPVPKGTIDSLVLLTERFGRRAGNMKMATLATYFGLGQQKHRSLDDVRMNLEVLKYCATVLFLESYLLETFAAPTRSRLNAKASPEESTTNSPSSSSKFECIDITSPTINVTGESHPNLVEGSSAHSDPFNMGPLSETMEIEAQLSNKAMEEGSSRATSSDASSGCTDFLELDEVSVPSIGVALVPFYHGSQKVQIVHKEMPLQIRCNNLKVQFGFSAKFVDHIGRPRLSFVVQASPKLCWVLDACDGLAKRLVAESGSGSEWRSVVIRKAGFYNSPTIRLHLPTVVEGVTTRWLTEIYQKDLLSTTRIPFSRYDVAELDVLFSSGTSVDAYFSLDSYDYRQTAGIRLVAKKLVVHNF